MRKTTSEKVEEKVPWHFLIPFTTIFGIVALLSNAINALGAMGKAFYASLGIDYFCYSNITTLPFITLLFAGGLGRLGFFRKRINGITLTWMYTIALSLSYYLGKPGLPSFCQSYGAFIGNRILSPLEETMRIVPWFMAPPTDVARLIVRGGVPTPWMDLMPMIFFWWIFTIIHGILMLSFASLIRKQWIDVERVPFPHTLLARELLIRVLPERKLKKAISPFLIGLLLGAIVWATNLCVEIFPWFPDIFMYKVRNCGQGGMWIVQPTDPYASIVAMARIGREPLGVAILYFAPTSTLFNMWFWWIIYAVLVQAAYYMGYYTGILERGGCGRGWCGEQSLEAGEPFKWTAFYTGGVWCLVIALLVLNRGFFINTFKAAFGRMDLSTKAEFEKNEPMSYRSIYLLLIGSFIASAVIFMICGINPISAILTTINLICMWLANLRSFGLVGVNFSRLERNFVLQKFMWPTAPEVIDRDYALSVYFNTWMAHSPELGAFAGANIVAPAMSYKMASLTGVSSRSIFKVSMVCMVIFSLMALPTWLWIAYTFGTANLPYTYGIQGCNAIVSRAVSAGHYPATHPWISQFFAGFVSVGIISWLHARYVWFPFEPMGFIIAIALGEYGFWSIGAVAWILKIITLKIGGSKLYEEFGAPMAGGYIVGHMLILIPGAVLGKIKFFFPF